jgi:hypothetical protein
MRARRGVWFRLMPDKIADATKLAKLLFEHAWAVWDIMFILLCLLFVPSSWLVPLGISPAIALLRPYIAVSFLAACGLVVPSVVRKIRDSNTSREKQTRLRQRLHSLTAAEQAVLQPFIRARTRTQCLHWRDGVVVALERAEVIYCATNPRQLGLPCDFNMHEWPYSYLIEHPELVGLNTSDGSH